MTDWVRLWHDMPTDPKWRVVARVSKQPVSVVISLFAMLMVRASMNAPRGTIDGFEAEDAAAALDIDESDVRAVLAAMQGRVIEANRLSGWERRQPKREDETAAERKRTQRDKTAGQSVTNDAVPHGHAASRTVTLDTEQNRTETDTKTPSGVLSADVAAPPVVDPVKVVFEQCLTWLKAVSPEDVEERKLRKLLGNWRRDYGDEAIIAAISRAARDPPVGDQVAWVIAIMKSGAGRGRNREVRSEDGDRAGILADLQRTRGVDAFDAAARDGEPRAA